MSNVQTTQQSTSIVSIDLSTPEGMSSFWKLACEQDNKDNKQTMNTAELPKLNKIAMKILKLKGIDLNNLERSNITSLRIEKDAVLTPDQIKNLLKGKVLCDDAQVLNITKSSDNINQDEKPSKLNLPSSAASVKSPKSIIASIMPFFCSLRPKVFAFKQNAGVQADGKENKNAYGSDQHTLSDNDYENRIPEALLKAVEKKKVMVVYFRKKKSKNYNQPGNAEDQLQNCAHNFNEEKCLENSAAGDDPILNNQKVIKQKIKISKEKYVETWCNTSNTTDFFSGNFPKDDKTNSEKKKKQETDQSDDKDLSVLNNPDLLIQSHNLIIPADLSKESLFQANPTAGCDTILHLFNSLSKNHSCNQHKMNKRMESKERFQRKKVCNHKEINNVQGLVQTSDTSNRHCELRNKRPVNSESVPANNSVTITSSKVFGENSCEQHSIAEPISTGRVPVNLNVLKLGKRDKQPLINLQEDDGVNDSVSKYNTYMSKEKQETEEETNAKSSIDLDEEKNFPLETNESLKSTIMVRRVEIDNSKEIHPLMINTFELSENGPNEIKIDINGDLISVGNHQNPSLTSLQPELVSAEHNPEEHSKVDGDISNKTIQLDIESDKYEITLLPNQKQKLFKKTTICCPVNSAIQQLRIIINVDSSHDEEKQLAGCENISCKNKSLDKEPKFSCVHVMDNDTVPCFDVITDQQKIGDGFKQEKDNYETFLPTNDGLSYEESTSLNKRIMYHNMFPNIDQSTKKQNIFTETGHLVNKKTSITYLKKRERKLFDENILGVDYHEKSINLANLGLKGQYKRILPNVKNRSVPMNVLSVPTIIFNNHECIKSDSYKDNNIKRRKYGHKNGRCSSRNKYHQEGISLERAFHSDLINKNQCPTDNLDKVSLTGKTVNDFLKDSDEVRGSKGCLKLCKSNVINKITDVDPQDSPVLSNKMPDIFNVPIDQEALVKQAKSYLSIVESNNEMFDTNCKIPAQVNQKNPLKKASAQYNVVKLFGSVNFCKNKSELLSLSVENVSPKKEGKEKKPFSQSNVNMGTRQQTNRSISKDISETLASNVHDFKAHSVQDGVSNSMKTNLSNFRFKSVPEQFASNVKPTVKQNFLGPSTSEVLLKHLYRIHEDPNRIKSECSSLKTNFHLENLYMPKEAPESFDGLDTASKTILSEEAKKYCCNCCTSGCLAAFSDGSFSNSTP